MKMSDNTMLEWMKSIDAKLETVSKDVTSLKETRAENKGVIKTASFVSATMASAVAWMVSLIVNHQSQ